MQETPMPDEGLIQRTRARLEREYLAIEKRADLTPDQKANRVRHVTCALCAGVAVQPLPFADIFLLTPLQALMASRIAAIRGVPVSQASAGETIKELLGVMGLGLAAQQLAIGAYKTVLPFLGGFTTIPLVYALTYAIGAVTDYYFTEKAAKRPIDPNRIKEIWARARKEGRREGRQRRDEIGKQHEDLEP